MSHNRITLPYRQTASRHIGTCAACGGEVWYTSSTSSGYRTCKGTCGGSTLRGLSPSTIEEQRPRPNTAPETP